MTSNSIFSPVTGLHNLSNESRIITTPWSRMVRGIGLGQYPVVYDPAVAARISYAFSLLAEKVTASNVYTQFSRLLTELILSVVNPTCCVADTAVETALVPILRTIRTETNPYWRLMASCILIDAVAKLDLDRSLLSNDQLDFPSELVAMLNEIQPNQIKDENIGRHGDYEKLSAYTAVFIALGQIGAQKQLITSERNYIQEALDTLDRVPAPFFRGRGGSMLFSAIALIGRDTLIFDGKRDYMREMLEHLDRADELNIPPAFPQPMSPTFSKIYPLLTMLNAIAISGRAEYLTYRKDRLAEAKKLLAATGRLERTHMGLYYIMALHNLGRLHEQLPNFDEFVTNFVNQWQQIDPGKDFFLHGIAYSYLIETAVVTGRTDLITEEMLVRHADAFADMIRDDTERANRPYPFAYALNMHGEIGRADGLFVSRARYLGQSALEWIVDNLSKNGVAEGSRLYMLDHALISYALRLRGSQSTETELFRHFRFRLEERKA
ncbi:hypothetical protein [Paraburkholderia sp. J67]|uniref:hypothetical protein n=1 Tax=Paraburkholderia sp. J67 TaxID=2805435 RepID=UPI002ABD4B6D|nr:hypothetical protein [Paraburkholderia sp. J67]